MSGTALIRVTQPPVIESVEALEATRAKWEQWERDAKSMVCTEETIQSVKKMLADMNKEYDESKAHKKVAKDYYMAPWNRVEDAFKENITVIYERAKTTFKNVIAEVEDVQKAECEKKCRDYFAELCAVHGVEWLRYEQAGLKISLTEAKKKTPSGLFDKLSDFVARVACDVDAIGGDAELMTEYKANGLNLAKAQKTIRDRREAAEAERKAAQERAERQKREAEAVAKVEAAAPSVAPPVAVEVPKRAEKNCYNCKYGGDGEEVDDYGHCWLHNGEPDFRQPDTNIGCAEWEPKKSEPILTCTFTVRGTRAQLIKVREFMKQEGISYE